jgi:hypothetical protein
MIGEILTSGIEIREGRVGIPAMGSEHELYLRLFITNGGGW